MATASKSGAIRIAAAAIARGTSHARNHPLTTPIRPRHYARTLVTVAAAAVLVPPPILLPGASALSTTSSTMASSSTPTPPQSSLLPQEPLRYLSGRPPTAPTADAAAASAEAAPPDSPITLDLSDLESTIVESDDRRQAAFDLSRRIGASLSRCRAASERGGISGPAASEAEDELAGLMATVFELSSSSPEAASGSADGEGGQHQQQRRGAKPRDGNLQYKVEDYVRHLSYVHFLKTGTLLPPSSVPSATDEEYLAGACIGLSQDLARYGIGRATVRDVRSVGIARDLVSDVMDQLLLFDFRNGPLRRKYDGTKYALRTLETVLYELSVTGAEADKGGSEGANGEEMAEPEAKRTRLDGGDGKERSDRVPVSELESLRKRMEHRDELRERLIKRCRDGQKAAKQSIFALHRGDASRARKLIEQCEDCVRSDLLPIVEEEPALRYGSFANVLEEYAEARLFYAWLHGDGEGGEGKDGPSSTESPSRPAGTLLGLSDFALHLEPEEYLGGLCDLTGEVGRYAVQRGTARDAAGVRRCLETNLSVLLSLQALSRFPAGGGMGKKMDPLRRSVEKLERMMYELSLVEATGGTRNVVVDSVKEVGGGGGGGGGGEHDES